jgi:hypothetical protein
VNAQAGQRRLGAFDTALVVVFVIGIYTGIEVHIGAAIPVPSVLSGVSGLVLLWRSRNDITPAHLMASLVVAVVYLGSILAASDLNFLPKRFTGFVQLIYSLTVGYALFLTLLRAERRQIAALFLGLCLIILVGALLEDYGGLRPISDAARYWLYDKGEIYDADLRDLLLYDRIRPKLFSSEPSAVTFAFTLLAFVWLLVSAWRWKLAGYLALMGGGLFALPGPTLLLMMLLLVPYMLLVTKDWGSGLVRAVAGLCFCLVLAAAFAIIGQSVYAARLHEIATGQDASFFYRVTGPALVARNVVATHPIAGAGLTGGTAIADEVINVFMQSPAFSPAWHIEDAGKAITNYFWLHWIYLGLVWGCAAIGVLTVWLKVLGVPSAPFCWIVWAILGQASGAYVGPKTWAVFFLAAAGAVIMERERPLRAAQRSVPVSHGGPRVVVPLVARGGSRW